MIRVHSRLEHLCPACGARICQLVWDPGGPGPPVLPSAMAAGLGMGADPGPDGDGDQAAGGWIRMDASGWHGSDVLSRFRWLPGREWMRERRAPYLPAWDVRTCELVEETGVLTHSPYMAQMAAPMQGDATWDVLYSLVRADLLAARNAAYEEAGIFYRVTREMIIERTRDLHTRPPDAGRGRRQA